MTDLRFFTVREVAELMKVTPPTVHRWIKDGLDGRKLRACHIGEYRIEENDLRKFLRLEKSDESQSFVPRSSVPTRDEINRVLQEHCVGGLNE